MPFSVKALICRPHECLDVQLETEIAGHPSMPNDYEAVSPLSFDGVLEHESGGRMALKGHVRLGLVAECARCLTDCPLQIDKEIAIPILPARLREEADPRELEMLEMNESYEGFEIDLVGVMLRDIASNLPSRVLCRDDCRGLCARCGKNLNDGDCSCDRHNEEPGGPFAKLKSLL